MKRVLLFLLLLVASPVGAQVAFDSTNATGTFNNDGTSASTNFTIGASITTGGSNRVGIVGCAASLPAAVIGATWSGVSMTELGRATNGTDGRGVVMYWIAAPPTSGSAVVVDRSGSGGAGSSLVCGAWAMTGAHQTTQSGTSNSADYTTTPTTLTCTRGTNEAIVDFVYALNAGAVPTASGGTKVNHQDQGTWYGAGSYNDASGSMGWNITGITRATEFCIPIQPASGGGGATGSIRTLTGVGR